MYAYYIQTLVSMVLILDYRDRRVEWQRRWPEALFRRLATLPISEFFHFKVFPLQKALIAAFVFFGGVLRFL